MLEITPEDVDEVLNNHAARMDLNVQVTKLTENPKLVEALPEPQETEEGSDFGPDRK